MLVQLWSKSSTGTWELIDLVDAASRYPLALPDAGCLRAIIPIELPPGDYSVDVGIGGDYRLAETMDFTIN